MKQRNSMVLLVLIVAFSMIAASCAPTAAPVVSTQIVKETVVVPGTAEVQIKEVVKTVVVEPTKAALGEGGIKVVPSLLRRAIRNR